MIFCIFYQFNLIWLGVGFLNRTGARAVASAQNIDKKSGPKERTAQNIDKKSGPLFLALLSIFWALKRARTLLSALFFA